MDYFTLYQLALEKPEVYWKRFSDNLTWFRPWEKVLQQKDKYRYNWFVNGKTNISYNTVDRHTGTALVFFPEDSKAIYVKFEELKRIVQSISSILLKLGLRKGKRITIYSPNSIQTLSTIFASARIGAIYSLIFAGLGKEAVNSRLQDFSPDIIVTSKYTVRRGNKIPLHHKGNIMFRQKDDNEEINDLLNMSEDVKVEEIESSEPLKVMYTSGTTGKPKGVILPHGSWMVGDYTVFDILFGLKPTDTVFTTADVGWITFSRVMYGTLLHGSTFGFMEGAPDNPIDRLVKIIDEIRPKVFFTSPTLLRMLRRYEIRIPRVEYIATAGEIFDEQTWEYAKRFADRVTDVYGQTELGYIIGTPYTLDGVETKPGYAGVPFPGAVVDTLDEDGRSVKGNPGYLVCKTPFPTQFTGILNDEERFLSYFKKFGYHDTGDVAILEGNYVKIVGRADDMIKVAGHRITSGEVENVIMEIDGVKDVAVVGIPDEVKGEKLIVFVVGNVNQDEITLKVRDSLGPIYIIDKIYYVKRLPKSRSGKVVRRALRDLLIGKQIDSSMLEDPEVIEEIKNDIR
ncbi:AMP-dependent synthetase [Sulfolobus acidocaldarius SUSAZ]|nr:AMP-dependent synthetase [Sulfolobus acidocaldarius SUSAZ]